MMHCWIDNNVHEFVHRLSERSTVAKVGRKKMYPQQLLVDKECCHPACGNFLQIATLPAVMKMCNIEKAIYQFF